MRPAVLVHLLDEVAEHLLGHVEIGDHAILQGADRLGRVPGAGPGSAKYTRRIGRAPQVARRKTPAQRARSGASCRSSVTGRPTTFQKSPSIHSTSAAPRPWIA